MDFMEWTCKRCYESNLKDANYCQRCGEFWENTYYNYGNAGKQQWPAPPQNHGRRKSRRGNRQDPQDQGQGQGQGGRGPKSPRRQKGKGKGDPKSPRGQSKGRGRGRDSYSEGGKGKSSQGEPPWIPLPPPPLPPAVPAQPLDAQTAQAEVQLKSMVKIISKDMDSYPIELQEEAKRILKQQEQWTSKKLHKTVSELSKARKSLHEASLARLQHHQAWKSFLVEAVARWENFTKQFAEEEKELAEKVNTAKEAVDAAKKAHLAAAREEKITEETETVMVSDEELMDSKPETVTKLQEGIDQMTQSLCQVKTKAEEILAADEQAHKRARLTAPDEPGDASSPSSAPHFAMAGK